MDLPRLLLPSPSMQVVIPTTDPAQARQDLATHGLALLTGVLSPAATRDVRRRLLEAVDASEADGVPTRGCLFDNDTGNTCVFHLFNFDPVFVELALHPRALESVRQSLGEAFLISNFSANITAPDSVRMSLHADQGYVPPPWRAQPLACKIGWLLDDFTRDNGGTAIVPGSHLEGRGPEPDEAVETVAVEAPAGTMMIVDGRLWHQTGENGTRDSHRAALFGFYFKRWLRPQINWNAALWPATVAQLTVPFLDWLGYYSGNVERQIPNGRSAAVRTPGLANPAIDRAFSLGPGAARGR